jgi:cobaltochelatase CobS
MIQFGEIKAPGEVKGRLHNSFKECVRLSQSERAVWLSGGAGTGKTTLAKQVAEALGLEFGFISCSQGMSEGHLLGRMTAHGDYLPSRFVEIYENGGLFLFDEIDAADSNTLIVLNSALANGQLSVPSRVSKPYADRHPDFICIAAANTWGSGSVEYSGRGMIDAATKDRFCGAKIHVDYDTDLEMEICAMNKAEAKKLHTVRKNCEEQKVRKIVSTRAFVSLARQMQQGITFSQFLEIFMRDWTAEEKLKAMKGVN